MFEGVSFPKSLDEEQFESWLENGRSQKIGYSHMLIIWDELEEAYQPIYTQDRDIIHKYERYGKSTGRESLVAAYDLYSESMIGLSH